MTREEMNEHIVGLLLNAFPDETVQLGQRLRRHQVEVLNLAIVRAKYERDETPRSFGDRVLIRNGVGIGERVTIEKSDSRRYDESGSERADMHSDMRRRNES
jgi:hypothetical protein